MTSKKCDFIIFNPRARRARALECIHRAFFNCNPHCALAARPMRALCAPSLWSAHNVHTRSTAPLCRVRRLNARPRPPRRANARPNAFTRQRRRRARARTRMPHTVHCLVPRVCASNQSTSHHCLHQCAARARTARKLRAIDAPHAFLGRIWRRNGCAAARARPHRRERSKPIMLENDDFWGNHFFTASHGDARDARRTIGKSVQKCFGKPPSASPPPRRFTQTRSHESEKSKGPMGQ